ncbi:2OG-Fe(II) oxygenase [Janibacter sp. YIM B02568]|uniref:2OG-Fe(II) oxygenase n=1 Tax=Janibacter endophyticus TaxID=2806261 RepID=UPI00195234BC|nr:2OG-Fe(II) oxygenase [Janibacter endophyticus]MBM6546488.1 2OG-Fe(II) oxygenase [Janibacter endophyticus]
MAARLVDLERLRAALPESAEEYRRARPYPHTVIDDVLFPEAFAAAVSEFPAVDDPLWKGYLHVNETKYSNTEPESWGPNLKAVAQELCSDEFVAYLSELTGIAGLIPDWSMDGGGLHQTLRGGHLNIHTDFSTHHDHSNWARRVNILLYLNESWPEEWGGQLELWDKAITRCEGKVTPAGNRMLVFTTSDESFHGHPDGLQCPEGEARRSLALYYFTKEESTVRRATQYRARPGAGIRRYMIWADGVALDVYDRLKRRLGLSDETAQKVLERIHTLRDRTRRR